MSDSVTQKSQHLDQTSSLPALGGSQYTTTPISSNTQEYLEKLCEALMMYGAPTHRLEEYMHASARAICITASFSYLPHSMTILFHNEDGTQTHRIIRTGQGVDLGKLRDIVTINKCVMHQIFTPERGDAEIVRIIKTVDMHSRKRRVVAYGLAAAAVGPFAFGARPIDLVPSFVLGCLIGVFQLQVVTLSPQFPNISEIIITAITSFMSRAIGSIRFGGVYLFCFSAMSQSSIALILPGYLILCAALELQTRHVVAGSVRMVYSVIYSMMLAFGTVIGTTAFGMMYGDATSEYECRAPAYWDSARNNGWILIYAKFIWVVLFTLSLTVVTQAKLSQIPTMVLISVAGYQATYWTTGVLPDLAILPNAFGAFVIGALANLYSRFYHGLAAAAMLPAIFVLVPSGIAASGYVLTGLASADSMSGATGFPVIGDDYTEVQSGIVINLGYGMTQLSMAISVGLCLSAILVYPYGNDALFSL